MFNSEKWKAMAELQPDTPDDHPHTVVRLDGPNADAWYLLDNADSMGLHLTRHVDGEESHQETLPWLDVAQMISNQTMRIYDMTDSEVDGLGE